MNKPAAHTDPGALATVSSQRPRASNIGAALALSSFINLLVLPWAGTLGDRFGNARIIVASSLLTAAALVVIATAVNVPMFWTGTALMGIAGSFVAPAVAAYAANHAPGGQFGATMGALRFGGDLGFVCGPVFLGTVIQLVHASHSGALIVNAAIVALTALAFTWAMRRQRLTAETAAHPSSSAPVSSAPVSTDPSST